MENRSILELDDYFLIRLLVHLKSTDPTKCAERLSSTCRRVRELSMPVLFSRIRQNLNISDASYPIPNTLWPYIKTIKLRCNCVDGDLTVPYWQSYEPQDSDVICGALANPTLHHALHSMPHLSTVIVCPVESHAFGHGLSWETLCSLLSLPQLNRLVLDWHVHMCPRPPDATSLQRQPSTPLSCLEYLLPSIRSQYSRPSEIEAVDRLLRLLHLSLETLSLPTEPASMDTIALLDWPHLRELKLRGLHWTSPHLPIVSLFANMPNLRVLSLELMEQEGASATALWPQGFPASYPWPYLESLSISHPDPDDKIYAHLPPTLQTLMLRSWPHQCIRRWQELNHEPDMLSAPHRSPASPSSLLRILRSCYTPHLRKLGVEYCSDGNEGPLLSHIASNFPRLTSLELQRYRLDGDDDIPVLNIARPLASLSELRILRMHLDFPEMPGPMLDRYSGVSYFWSLNNPENLEQRLQAASVTFAQVLKPSLQQVWHFVYKYFQLHWCIYDVGRTQVDGVVGTVHPLGNVVYETQWR
ncbi:hypothetical protein K466DRAFT_657735 [Polyporus arcularius HHB13444]|uniref:F-box domain-containing protein n=1 Tax=Polyporus arcularius HHB13444 TaxID=1314778 RepID=A0A5C3Q2X8_9APHY|nr:hypothetical protein K466DRAFT_657735 [Polyporus arcularius HHB13444]